MARLTKKEILSEIVKCGKDPVYFLKNYARISHPLRGLILFKLFEYQEDLIRDFADHRFNVINKGRQLGISTLTAGYIVWLMLFHKNKTVLVMATKFETAGNLVRKVKNIMKNLPDWIRIADITADNRTSFELSNASSIKAASTSGDAGRSEALSLLVLDEAAHIEGLEELWTGLYPTLSTGGRCIAISTPNGVGNWFHQTCVGAESGDNNFKLTSLMWWVHPERDKEWFEKETKNMSRRQIAQELECNFNTSGDTVIATEDMEWLESLIQEPKYRTGFDRNFWIWRERSQSNTYLICADVARGDAVDYSAFILIELETMEVIGEYKGKPTPDLFANMLNQVGREFNNAMIVVENNSIGFTVLDKLQEMEYPNIYFSIKSTHEYVEQYIAENTSGAVAGFSNTPKTRPLIVAKLEEFIRNKLIIPRSSRLINEFRTFIWNNGKAMSMKGYNDDLVMSLAIACWIRDTALQISQKELNYQKAFVDSIIVSKTRMNTRIAGQIGYDGDSIYSKKSEAREAYKNYGWIIK